MKYIMLNENMITFILASDQSTYFIIVYTLTSCALPPWVAPDYLLHCIIMIIRRLHRFYEAIVICFKIICFVMCEMIIQAGKNCVKNQGVFD